MIHLDEAIAAVRAVYLIVERNRAGLPAAELTMRYELAPERDPEEAAFGQSEDVEPGITCPPSRGCDLRELAGGRSAP